MPSSITKVWREPRNCTACYFCQGKVTGYKAKNKKDTVYPNLAPAMRLVPRSADLPLPSTKVFSDSISRAGGAHYHLHEHDDEFQASASDCMPQLFCQPEINNLVCDLRNKKEIKVHGL
jgi:hypothetical protein